MATITLNVDGMSCGGCEKSIRNVLLEQKGVNDVTASHKDGTVKIEFDDAAIGRPQLAAAVEGAGFDVTG